MWSGDEEAVGPSGGNARPDLTTPCKQPLGVVHFMATRTVRQTRQRVEPTPTPVPAPAVHERPDEPSPALPRVGREPDPSGFLVDSWLPFENALPVQVNSQAPAGAILAWCWGEVAHLKATAHMVSLALANDPQVMGQELFEKLFMHRLHPLEEVMKHAMDRLAREVSDATR